MRLAIRVDASAEIGTGHLRRCLTLARELVRFDAEVWLVCRPLDGVALTVLRGVEIPVLWLPVAGPTEVAAKDDTSTEPQHAAWARVGWTRDAQETVSILQTKVPDWVVVDHYAFDARWHKAVAECLNTHIAVIDDLGDRDLYGDLLIDHNLAIPDHRFKYHSHIAKDMIILGGAQFAMLGPAYAKARRYRSHGSVRSIGIFMGGTDLGNISAMVVQACRDGAEFFGKIEIVTTTANPYLQSLIAIAARWPHTQLLLDLPDLAAFFSRHDLQIGAGGGATWERCCIGAPTLALVIAENQRQVLGPLETLGVLRTVPETILDPVSLGKEIRLMIDNPELCRKLGERAQSLVDGQGTLRIAQYMNEICTKSASFVQTQIIL